jgi:hypothetical protein
MTDVVETDDETIPTLNDGRSTDALSRSGQAKLSGYAVQSTIIRQERRPVSQLGRCEQVEIDVADAAPMKTPGRDEGQHLRIGRNDGPRQTRQRRQN